MTRANDIASLVDSNGDIVAGALDNVPASNDASALTTGTLAAARLPSTGVDASSLSAGTLDAARLPSSGVDAASITTGTLNSARVSLANSDITGNPIAINQIGTTALWSGITHGSNNGNSYGYYYNDVAIGSYTTSKTIAVIFRQYYSHGGGADHGYLGGYLVQAGETDAYPNRADFYMAHYNDYYNTDSLDVIMPWNSSGTQSVRFNVTNSHNTNTLNSYKIHITATIERA